MELTRTSPWKMLNKAAYLLLVNLASASTFIRFCRSVRKVYLCTTVPLMYIKCNAPRQFCFAILLSLSHTFSQIRNWKSSQLFFLFNIQVAQNSSYIGLSGFFGEPIASQNVKEMCWVASDEITHKIGSRVPSGNFPWNFPSDVVELVCVKKKGCKRHWSRYFSTIQRVRCVHGCMTVMHETRFFLEKTHSKIQTIYFEYHRWIRDRSFFTCWTKSFNFFQVMMLVRPVISHWEYIWHGHFDQLMVRRWFPWATRSP